MSYNNIHFCLIQYFLLCLVYGNFRKIQSCDLIWINVTCLLIFLIILYRKKSMASKIPQLQSKMTQASAAAANHGASYYKLLMEQNKHYIQEPPTVEKCQSLAKQLFYTRLARFALSRFNVRSLLLTFSILLTN
jgi:hypothetical protein